MVHEAFPLIQVEKHRSYLVTAKRLCLQGIEECTTAYYELNGDLRNAITEAEREEIVQTMDMCESHIAFCKMSLREINNGLKQLNIFFN